MVDAHGESLERNSRPGCLWFWLKRLGKALLLAVVVGACTQAWRHYQVCKQLDETLAEMDRAEPGWRLADIEAARDQIPEEQNSARIVTAAARLLPRNWPPKELDEHLTHLDPEEQLSADDFGRVQQELAEVRPALKEARKLAALPRGRHRIEYKPFVLDTILEDQQQTRRVARLLCYDALRHEQQGEIGFALNACQAAFHAARSLGDEPFAISQLIRMSVVISSCQAIERVLAQGEPPPEELEEVQGWLGNEDDFRDLFVIACGERASMHEMFTSIERGDVPLTDSFFGSRPSWEEYLDGWFTRRQFREAHPSMLAMNSRFVTIAQLPMHEQAASEEQLLLDLRDLKQSNPVAALFIPALNKVGAASRRKHAYLRCLNVALAAERYRREKKAWPANIDKLCPKYLAAVPLDPFDGQPLRYRRLDDGVIIYSVSHDGIDNKGNLDRAHPDEFGVDIGFRLWDADKRRQPPMPKPPAPLDFQPE